MSDEQPTCLLCGRYLFQRDEIEDEIHVDCWLLSLKDEPPAKGKE